MINVFNNGLLGASGGIEKTMWVFKSPSGQYSIWKINEEDDAAMVIGYTGDLEQATMFMEQGDAFHAVSLRALSGVKTKYMRLVRVEVVLHQRLEVREA